MILWFLPNISSSGNRQFYNEPAKILSPEAKQLLMNYAWPGNIRELANAIERAYVLTPSREILPAALPMEIMLSGSASCTAGRHSKTRRRKKTACYTGTAIYRLPQTRRRTITRHRTPRPQPHDPQIQYLYRPAQEFFGQKLIPAGPLC